MERHPSSEKMLIPYNPNRSTDQISSTTIQSNTIANSSMPLILSAANLNGQNTLQHQGTISNGTQGVPAQPPQNSIASDLP